MLEQRNIAVVGCGGWGKNIVRTMVRLDRLGAVVDPCEDGRARAKQIIADAGVDPASVQVLTSPDALLNDPGIRAVMIATPAETHYDIARRMLDAGKDVFVEKPLTIDVAEARDLVQRANTAGRVLMVGHLLEYHPGILKLLDLIAAGDLGEIRYVVSNRLNLGKIRTEENALWSFAPHDIAVILRIVGAMPSELVATGGSYVTEGVADVTVTQMRFRNGVRGHIFVSWLHPFKEQKLVVVGSKNMASFCDVEKQLMLYDQHVDWQEGQPVPVRGVGTPVEYSSDEPLMCECAHFVRCVDERLSPRTDGANGLRVLQILHAAEQSLSRHGSPISLSGMMSETEIDEAELGLLIRTGNPEKLPMIETFAAEPKAEPTPDPRHAAQR